jgi:hypothetical protein
MGLSPYSPDAPSPYRQPLYAPQSDLSSGEPCPFTKVPDGPPDSKSLCTLCPRNEPSYTTLFSLKVPASKSPPGTAPRPLWRERYALTGHFYMSLDVMTSITEP